ncbi:iron complex transport system permease protein [Nocardioides zeae]|uniref:Iron complex transport system permease protein n=1 Tax=Nocardioides zeae TaxID=1457234 RepID=A0ACC6ILP2_9ACTN|nr:iron chelate uptake ABC transporter family permease subunit [Nocardioides zeae]MDR6175092.1 iron complex transport system permease protein [Nocardioides zeae]MDR6211670.1 iron complex transport system permease protein [Nocardioides zeae]
MSATVTTAAREAERVPVGLTGSNRVRTAGLLIVLLVLLGTCVASIAVGARDIAPSTLWAALTAYDDTVDEHVMVRELRVPRTVVGLVVGPALGVCGALIQAFTRNPLADPGILGVNAGATFGVTAAVGFLGLTAPLGYVWFALAGAGTVTVLVYLLGSAGGGRATPAKLTLAGVALSAVLGGLTTAIVLSDRETFDDLRFWGVGSIGGRQLDLVLSFTPLIVLGLLLALVVARPLNALALGDDLGTALGVRTGRVRVLVVVAVTLLAGTATALAGPIGFVGLVVPHVVRWFVGPDQRWILAFTVLAAPVLLLASDVVGRIAMPNGELRVGLVTALVGAPVLLVLARRRSVSGL